MYDFFLQIKKNNYNLKSQTGFAGNSVNTNKFHLNSPRYIASKVWNMVPLEMKSSQSVGRFQTKI